MRRLSLLFALSVCGCPDSSDDKPDGSTTDARPDSGPKEDATPEDSEPADADPIDADPIDASDSGTMPPDPEDCDPLQPEVCSFPWPSNLYLSADPSRATGYTLSFGDTSLPANRVGDHVDPEPYRRMDGYGLGTPILVLFPDLDFAGSGLHDETDIGASFDAEAPINLYRVSGTELIREPIFAELDGFETDPARRTLIVRPAVILREATRYVVTIQNLRDTDGNVYDASEAFAALKNGDATDPLLAPRQARFDSVFELLNTNGIDPDPLQLAWDFNTASSSALHGRLLTMRDDALARQPMGPQLTITSTTEYTLAEDPDLWFRVEGTMTVPSYLRTKAINFFTHTVLNLDANGVPQADGMRTANFWINVPRSVMSSTTSHGLLLYGHGLLGSGSQVLSGYNRPTANRYHYIYCGANLTGFSEDDQLAVASAVSEMSGFEWLADTMHQGVIEYLLLARAMRDRLPGLPFFQNIGANIDTDRLYYEGISQGGIFGGTIMAISTDFTRGHLGVPGQNYSTLLPRSSDFTPFFEMIATAYGDSRDHQVLIAAAQLLWDGTDPVSYYRHISAEPFPNTPAHQVLLGPAKGDYQVAVLTTEIIARSNVGIPIMANYDDERTVYGITEQPYPHSGSGIVLWDFGNPWPPPGTLPPMDGLGDPHGLPRREPVHNDQMDHFFRTGEIIDTCGGDGCHPD